MHLLLMRNCCKLEATITLAFRRFSKKNKIGYNKILFNRFFSFPAYLSVMMLPRIAIDLFNVC